METCCRTAVSSGACPQTPRSNSPNSKRGVEKKYTSFETDRECQDDRLDDPPKTSGSLRPGGETTESIQAQTVYALLITSGNIAAVFAVLFRGELESEKKHVLVDHASNTDRFTGQAANVEWECIL
jgi:hypothetical protein